MSRMVSNSQEVSQRQQEDFQNYQKEWQECREQSLACEEVSHTSQEVADISRSISNKPGHVSERNSPKYFTYLSKREGLKYIKKGHACHRVFKIHGRGRGSLSSESQT